MLRRLLLLAPLLLALLPPRTPLAPNSVGPHQTTAPAAEPAAPTEQQEEESYVCPPCGADCHGTTHAAPGSCPGCGMELVPASSIPTVVVLLFEGADVLSLAGPLGVFASSGAARVTTVADTSDPVRCQGALSIVPDHDFASVPAADVLILPSGYARLWEDELVLGWIRTAARGADHVLSVGMASLTLAAGGLVPEGTHVPTPPWLAPRASEIAPGPSYTSDERAVRHKTLHLVRDARGALDASFVILRELAGSERAQRTARSLGWEE